MTDDVRDAAKRRMADLLAPDTGGLLAKLRPGEVVVFRGRSGPPYRYEVGSEEKSFLATPELQAKLLEEDLATLRSNLLLAAAQLLIQARYPGGLGI
jgi:hypothetical protein